VMRVEQEHGRDGGDSGKQEMQERCRATASCAGEEMDTPLGETAIESGIKGSIAGREQVEARIEVCRPPKRQVSG